MSVEDIIAFNWIQELKTKAEQWVGRTFIPGWENLSNQVELLLSLLANGGQLTDKDIPIKKIIINNILEYPIIGAEYGYEIPPINSTRVFKYQNTFGIFNLKWSGAYKNGGEYRVYPNWTIITPNIKKYSDKFSFTEQYTNFQSIAEISSPIPTQARERESRIYIAINGRFALYYDRAANTFNIMKDGVFYKSIPLMQSCIVLGTICDMDGVPLWSNGNLLYSENNIWYLPQPLKAMTYTGHLYLFPLYGREIWECSL